ncbi:peptidoglycan editing factor PgeF [Gymnodinialimonas ceratoperidinii]|uniref:Purine nucleoside phosphorylase n=1 Tax=Gymnodinialimonas ceratoperidinii TaxID=2856823 RepID=A0A8F6TXK8_9RHOB|nr:peptidoglycan editing factor PgeF [Gymnodinialimonas ceratoperidinii]QXT40782.1 peptidoglycan editing factor PgeF [Gymnodinialimonas ceratoperidinii]
MTLSPLTSPLLDGVTHGFFTRQGGASTGIYRGLNCGTGSSDQAEVVAMNRARVADVMGVDALAGVHQIHSATAVIADTSARPRADALVTADRGVALTILTADCQPVLFADTDAGVIGAAHAGWKGAVDGVLEATLDKMEELGAKRGQTRAVIGPSISQRAYEVGEEFFERFLDEDPDNARFFANGAEGKYQFDLVGFGLARLRAAGVAEAEWTGHCTYSDPERFYSYRRATHNGEADYGRLIAAIRL